MIFFIILITFFIHNPVNQVNAQAPASGSAENISESVRERLLSVVHERSNLGITGVPVAYMGILQSVSGNTLSVLTDDGIKLASISASTYYLRPPAKKSLTLDDLPLESFVTTVGTSKSESVLDTETVMIQESPPASPSTSLAYGTVVSYNPKEYLLTLLPSQGEPQTFLISRKATLNRWLTDGTKEPFTRTSPLDPGSQVLVVYSPNQGPNAENLINDLLVKSLL